MKHTIVIANDGQRMQVIRPANPDLALAIVTVAVEHNDGALFDRLPEEVGGYTFVGYMGRRAKGGHCIVAEDGAYIGEIQPGDSFVTDRT